MVQQGYCALAAGHAGEKCFPGGNTCWERIVQRPAWEPTPLTSPLELVESFDFFDAKGALEALLEDAGVRDWSMGPPAGWPFHPARSAGIVADTEGIGVVGEIHPSLVERLDLGGRVAAAEVDVQALMAHASSEIEVRDVPRFPPVRRDLAFVLDATVPAAPVQVALLEAGGDVIEACLLFDVFSGTPLPEGKKSLAFSLDLRAPDRTLTDEEADAVVRRIAGRLASEFGAELRAI